MRPLACSAALALLLFACGGEERSAESAAPAATAAPAPSGTTAESTTAPSMTYDVTGSYFPIDPLPPEFADLEHLLLATIDENAAPAPLNGFLRPKAREANDYMLVKPSIEGKRLTFTTTDNGGVHYAFRGEFEVLANFAENPPSYETTVLAGTLEKIRGGNVVASTPVRFRYEAGG